MTDLDLGGPGTRGKARAWAALVAAAAVVPFAISGTFGFVWDDWLLLVENPYVTGGTPWRDLFTHDLWAFAPGNMARSSAIGHLYEASSVQNRRSRHSLFQD